MSGHTKIELSKLELELMKNSEWILTKHSVIQKVSALFSELVPEITAMFSSATASFIDVRSCKPKISRGERYQNLPYVILDYPAVFKGKDIFALRTMFLWGNFISVTLQLSGIYKTALEKKIIEKINFSIDGQYLGIGEDQWQHSFSAENYQLVSELNSTDLENKMKLVSFLKIAIRYELEEAGTMEENIKKACQYMAGLL